MNIKLPTLKNYFMKPKFKSGIWTQCFIILWAYTSRFLYPVYKDVFIVFALGLNDNGMTSISTFAFFVSLVIIVSIKNILGFIIFNFVCSIRFKYKFGFYCYCMLSVIENEMISRVNTLVSRFLNVLKWNDQSLEVSHQVSNVIPEEPQRRSTFYLK